MNIKKQLEEWFVPVIVFVFIGFAIGSIVHKYFQISYKYAFVLGCVAILVLIFGGALLAGAFRMRYSAEGDAALQLIVEEVRKTLGEDNELVVEVKGYWLGGYPNVAMLCKTNDACNTLRESGMLKRIATKVGESVRNDPSFGRNKKRFDEKLAVWATGEKYTYHHGRYGELSSA